ncbi:MAG: acyl-ACP--UDP-N-acetylglucosamine O-acyltransferase [Gammaproteobacteria bacterium]
MIDPRADVDPRAEIADGVEIGPWVRIGPGVTIGPGTRVDAHCVIEGPTVIGSGNQFHAFCAIGTAPQDKKFDPAVGRSQLRIGDGNTFREYCSVNRGTHGGGGATTIGNDNWVMAYCHIAHDCHVGNNTVFANNSTLAGHVEVHDHVILGGFTGVHQFCRLGEGSFTAIAAIVVRDVPPFVIVNGNTARPRTINSVGLRRRGADDATIARLKRCFRALYRQGHRLEQALDIIAEEARDCPRAMTLLEFVRSSSRGIAR